ncbi:MAG: SUN domain-containing protein [Chitinophagales bacterium]|nr:SUN domain-containing protein [Chitinophagales bacterium]
MLSKVKNLVSNNQAMAALALLKEDADDQWEEAIILLQSSQVQLSNEKTQQLISSEEAQRRQNQINAGILTLLGHIEQQERSSEDITEQLKGQFWKPELQQVTQNDIDKSVSINHSNITIGNNTDVVIGSGNKIFKSLGRWQFWAIIMVLLVIGGTLFYGGKRLFAQQENTTVSLTSIQNELAKLASAKGENFTQQIPELKEKISAGVNALNNDNYDEAIQQLEEVAKSAKLATVYQALEDAYLKKGDVKQAYKMRQQALRINPAAYAERSLKELKGKTINLLAPENGGSMKAASDPKMAAIADQNLGKLYTGSNNWIVFSFKDEQEAELHSFDYYVPSSNKYHIESFDLLVSNDSPTDNFTSIGTFQLENVYLSDQPFQHFTFEPVKARYIKFQINAKSTTGVYMYEIRLWGKLE